MSFLSEFKSFALKRNALDLAIGVVIGASFQSVVDALVNNLLMPPNRALSGTLPGEAWELTLGELTFGIGAVFNAILQFVQKFRWLVFNILKPIEYYSRRVCKWPAPL